MHDQPRAALCSAVDNSAVGIEPFFFIAITQTSKVSHHSECIHGLYCKPLHAANAQGVGICTSATQSSEPSPAGAFFLFDSSILLRTGSPCHTSIECDLPRECCRDFMHGRAEPVRKCEEFDDVLTNCIFDDE